MPRVSKSGKQIFPASEVAEFTVCPNAWFLKRVNRAPILEGPDVERGQELHRAWAEDVEYGFTIGRLLRLLAALFMSATVLMMLLGQ